MASPANAPLDWVIGDDETVEVYIYSDRAGTVPVDISGRSYTLSVATKRGATPVLSLAGTVTGASGLVSFTATDAQTSTLLEGFYDYDVVEVSDTAESTIILSTINVTRRVMA